MGRFVLLVTLIVGAGGCGTSWMESFRRNTYPPDFRYVSDEKLRSSMWLLGRETIELRHVLADPSLSEATRRTRAELMLGGMEDTVRKIGPEQWSSNHPELQSGLQALRDPVRPEVANAIAACRRAGIRVFMVTGDHRRTAEAVARTIGLVVEAQPLVFEGRDLSQMSDSVLSRVLEQPVGVFARTSAEQKLRIVRLLRGRGDVVAVTGDGVNDAPALKAADVGVAMGRVGSDVAREAARVILLDDNFRTIVAAIEEGRAVWENLRKFITYIFTSNIPEIVPYLAFVLFGIPLPLTVPQILAVDLGTDMVPALGLGAEFPRADSMSTPPRARRERLLNGTVLLRSYGFLGIIEAVTALGNYFVVLAAGGWTLGRELAATDPLYLRATTACLAAIVVTQVAAGLTCRSPRESLWRLGAFTNPLLSAGIALELALLLAIVLLPPLQHLLGTAPLPWFAWLLPIFGALVLLGADEFVKALARRRAARNASGPIDGR